jgi:hypothetical protein
MKVHLGKNLINDYYILAAEYIKFYWTKDTSEIIGDKFESSFEHEEKNIQEWVKNCRKNGIRYFGYFDTDEYPSIDNYKKDYPEFFI